MIVSDCCCQRRPARPQLGLPSSAGHGWTRRQHSPAVAPVTVVLASVARAHSDCRPGRFKLKFACLSTAANLKLASNFKSLNPSRNLNATYYSCRLAALLGTSPPAGPAGRPAAGHHIDWRRVVGEVRPELRRRPGLAGRGSGRVPEDPLGGGHTLLVVVRALSGSLRVWFVTRIGTGRQDGSQAGPGAAFPSGSAAQTGPAAARSPALRRYRAGRQRASGHAACRRGDGARTL